MTKLLDSTLVLCDLDHLLLAGDGNMPQVVRDVLQLFSSRTSMRTMRTPTRKAKPIFCGAMAIRGAENRKGGDVVCAAPSAVLK